jgi:hypothetical protein
MDQRIEILLQENLAVQKEILIELRAKMKSSRLIHIVVGGDAVYVRLFQFLSLLLVDLERHLVLQISN